MFSFASRTGPSGWRDIKVYNNTAYIGAEASHHGMQVTKNILDWYHRSVKAFNLHGLPTVCSKAFSGLARKKLQKHYTTGPLGMELTTDWWILQRAGNVGNVS